MRGGRVGRGTLWRRRLVAVAALAAIGLVAAWLVSRAIGPDQQGADVETITIDSKAVGEKLPVNVVVPPGGGEGRRPLLVFLHGRGGDEHSSLDDPFYEALAELGERAPIVAFPYGGDHSYWHDRADGDWGTYVVDEVIPGVARRFDADPKRVAIGGISMGGYGALDLAVQHPGRFCAVGGHSPAIWASASETAAGAFDDPDDFARNDVVGAARSGFGALSGQPLWVDAGADDPFQPGDQALAEALASADRATVKLDRPGGHDRAYWNAHYDEYMRFYAKALRHCRR